MSYIRYRADSNGAPVEPTFEDLPGNNGVYYVSTMVVMTGLPQLNTATDELGDAISSLTYANSKGTGEKLVNGSTYWTTEYMNNDTIDDVQSTYSMYTTSSDTIDLDVDDYMLGFAVRGRYTHEATFKITVTGSSDLKLYFDGENELLSNSVEYYVGSENRKIYTFTHRIGTSQQNYLIKLNAREHDYQLCIPECWSVTDSPLIQIQFDNVNGQPGYNSLVDDVETFRYSTLSANNYVQTLVGGGGFNSSLVNERSIAQVPPDARGPLQQAQETNPTENRVFDINLLMEQITAQFQDFRNNVRSKIYNLLAWEITVNLGVVSQTIRITALADFVWSLVDSVAFRTIERIIDWFNTEERKDRIAKILLEDEELQESMNFNNPDHPNYDSYYDPDAGLNYWAVAKLGILVFADYIHDTFIGSNEWADSTWNWVMNNINSLFPNKDTSGWTLVEIVNEALGAIGSAIQAIKDAATAVWNGIKAGLQFIANAVLNAIVAGMSFAINSALNAIAYLISSISNDVIVVSDDPLKIQIFDEIVEIGLSVDELQFNLQMGDMMLSIDNIISTISNITPETLSVIAKVEAYAFINILSSNTWSLLANLLFNSPAGISPSTQATAMVMYISMVILPLLTSIGIVNQANDLHEKQELAHLFMEYHFSSLLSLAAGILLPYILGKLVEIANHFNLNEISSFIHRNEFSLELIIELIGKTLLTLGSNDWSLPSGDAIMAIILGMTQGISLSVSFWKSKLMSNLVKFMYYIPLAVIHFLMYRYFLNLSNELGH